MLVRVVTRVCASLVGVEGRNEASPPVNRPSNVTSQFTVKNVKRYVSTCDWLIKRLKTHAGGSVHERAHPGVDFRCCARVPRV